MLRRHIFSGGLGTVALATAALAATSGAQVARANPSGIPDIDVTDQEGSTYRFYSDLIRDRVVMVNFFFQSCGETCPLVTQNLRFVQDLLGERMGHDIFMYSITLQPQFDQPHILKDYAQLWDVRSGWKFLTGKPEQIEHLRRSLGFASLDPDYDLILDNHTGMLRYGNARLDRWAATPALARPEWIAKAVTSLSGRPLA
jgi:protein SCO1/2